VATREDEATLGSGETPGPWVAEEDDAMEAVGLESRTTGPTDPETKTGWAKGEL